ncbi:MAG: hypothetical protein IKW39_03795, partial [Alphaproteobacteria bacterium]|nr:hypothetical protein [Alphaproteobacteria bacterium]
ITYKLNSILFSSASMVFSKEGANVSYFPLIKTSKNSSLIESNVLRNKVTPRKILENFTVSNGSIILAAEFLSNDPNKPFDVIAIGDTDIIYDDFWTREKNFLNKSYYIPLFDNGNFILNSLDYLTENDDLISLRGKTAKKRHLKVVEDMRRLNMYRYKLKENDIFNAIEGAKEGLKEIIAKKEFEERDTFSADELAIIGNIRKEINDLKQELSNIKITANSDIDKLEVKVKFFNIYFIAILIMILVLIVNFRNQKLSLLKFKEFFIWNKSLLKLFYYVSLILGIAIFSVYLDNKNTIVKYEGKNVFKDFKYKLNTIKTIKLRGYSGELIFKQKNGLWELENTELPVYQERIRSFLVTLNNMVYYEKKSDKVEDMKYFGISSIKSKDSPTIEVKLEDDSGNTIKSFDIGWYDIDLGRGSKASFIRLENQFQVWMVEADFYDLSLDKKDWTYSSLWNLRYGRFIEYNDTYDDDSLMNMVKKLLNIYTIGFVKNIDTPEYLGNINVKSENDNNVKLVFYKNKDNRFFVKYDFLLPAKGKHLETFEKYIKEGFLEITKEDWELLKDDVIR